MAATWISSSMIRIFMRFARLAFLACRASDESALGDFVEDGLVADFQDPGRLRSVPLNAVEHLQQRLPLGFECCAPGDFLQAEAGTAVRRVHSWGCGIA